MTNEEVAQLLGKMAVVWPKADVEPATVALWAENLAKIKDPVRANETVAMLMEETPFWPHWSEFTKAYQRLVEAERRDSQVVSRAPALPPREPLAADVRNMSARLRNGPSCGKHAADQLVTLLEDAWGPFKDRARWVERVARMDVESVAATVDIVSNGDKQMSWREFMKSYWAQVDKISLAQYAGN